MIAIKNIIFSHFRELKYKIFPSHVELCGIIQNARSGFKFNIQFHILKKFGKCRDTSNE